MDGPTQRAIAIWTILGLPFPLFAWALAARDELTAGFALYYWGPVLIVTLLGILPPPWRPFVD